MQGRKSYGFRTLPSAKVERSIGYRYRDCGTDQGGFGMGNASEQISRFLVERYNWPTSHCEWFRCIDWNTSAGTHSGPSSVWSHWIRFSGTIVSKARSMSGGLWGQTWTLRAFLTFSNVFWKTRSLSKIKIITGNAPLSQFSLIVNAAEVCWLNSGKESVTWSPFAHRHEQK